MMRSYVVLTAGLLLCACASPSRIEPAASFQSAAYIARDGELPATSLTKSDSQAPSDAEKGSPKLMGMRIYWFFGGR
jgi:hypothetical protein